MNPQRWRDPERWRELSEVFGGAIELPPQDRAAYLNKACANEELRREAESLLQYDGVSRGVFAAPVAQSLARLLEKGSGARVDPGSDDPRPHRLGPYTVSRELGRGGVGTVYLAVRDNDQYQQRVALKVIHPDRSSPENHQRFRRECRILASLDHPNIARLLDAGTSDDGWPYVAMELVEGQPIDRYCEVQGLDRKARIELFRAVCSAVHDAHQNLIVHRDLKPSNILVTADGVPKLLDFGIAKLLNPELAHEALHSTRPSLLPMTPAYASPEQVQGESITTASDIYSLGVLLYGLLTGRHPYSFTRRTPGEVERVICHTAPRDPNLTSDLDAILLKALRKEPKRRYGSAEQLSDDLHRYLRNLPVTARKDTWSYRTWKLVQRNRFSASLLALLFFLGMAVTVQSVRATRALDMAEQQRQRAEQVTQFMISLFEAVDPDRTRGETITAREILDAGTPKVMRELSDQPLARASLLEALGLVHQKLGLLEQAGLLLEQALEIRLKAQGRQHVEVARGFSFLAFQRLQEGDPEAALVLNGQSLELRRALHGEFHPEVAASLNDLGEAHLALGEVKQAEQLLRQGLEMRQRLLGEQHPAVGESLSELARLIQDHGAAAAALPLFRRALDIERRHRGDEHTAVATLETDLARLVQHEDPLEAEALFRRALATYHRILGSDHSWTTIAMRNLARLRQRQGDFDEAETLLSEALRLRRKAWPAGDPRIAYAAQDLAYLALAREEYERAAELLGESFSILRVSLGPDDWQAAAVGSVFGECLTRLGRYDEAEDVLLASHGSLARLLGEEHDRTRVAVERLAELELARR